MAQRRMFSLKIVSSDAFLDMPSSSRELYFQLGMHADDDGFVNPKKIIRMINASDDDLKILIGKRFVLQFENGVIVIKHWLINNLIRKDFYQETIYLEEKNLIITKENKAYTECQQNVNKLAPQVRLGKVRLGKDNIDNTIQPTADDTKNIIQIMDIFRTINPTLNYGNKTNRKSCQDLIKQFGLEDIIKIAKYAVKVQGQNYAPTITTPYQLKEKLAQLKIYSDKSNKPKFKTI